MKIVCFDVGKVSGWAFMGDGIVYAHGTIEFKSLGDYLERIKHAIREYKPDCIGSARATRFARVIAYQSKLLAIVELCAEKADTPFFELIDSQCKKTVLGKGVAKKEEIIEWAEERCDKEKLSEHEADSVLFAEYLNLTAKSV